jgi:DnaK suppressor protein
MLTKAFLKKTKERLISERDELSEKSSHRPDIDTDGDEIDEIQGNQLIELQNQLNTRNNAKLNQILDALRRMQDKTYGVCQDCGENIPEKRLSVNPYFLTCVSCAEEREMEGKRKRS